MSGNRSGKSMPDERVIEQICALSGDDPAVIAAQIQGERARTPEGKTMWKMIAARLAGGDAILAICGLAGGHQCGGARGLRSRRLAWLFRIDAQGRHG